MAYRHLLAAQVRSQAQYRASLAIDAAGSVLFGVLDIVSVVVLFRVTPTLGGFVGEDGVTVASRTKPRPLGRAAGGRQGLTGPA